MSECEVRFLWNENRRRVCQRSGLRHQVAQNLRRIQTRHLQPGFRRHYQHSRKICPTQPMSRPTISSHSSHRCRVRVNLVRKQSSRPSKWEQAIELIGLRLTGYFQVPRTKTIGETSLSDSVSLKKSCGPACRKLVWHSLAVKAWRACACGYSAALRTVHSLACV